VKKSFKGNYPMTVCSLTKAGRDALESYARMLKYVSGATGGSMSSGS
jgi:hypothetical protein